jgi:hypothetical protein
VCINLQEKKEEDEHESPAATKRKLIFAGPVPIRKKQKTSLGSDKEQENEEKEQFTQEKVLAEMRQFQSASAPPAAGEHAINVPSSFFGKEFAAENPDQWYPGKLRIVGKNWSARFPDDPKHYKTCSKFVSKYIVHE